ncbi:MAG: tail fiber protein [Burkholderiales bacterium]|nr:tail fiber protein [Opitutaceae bacterium]
MSEPFLGEIRMVGFNYNPRGWAFCNGQLMSIAQNSALFALLGTTYGGDGITTFALPDLRSRLPVGSQGVNPALPAIQQGELGGTTATTLTLQNLPIHTHAASYLPTGGTPLAVSVAVANIPAPASDPTGGILAQSQVPSRSAPTVVNSYAAVTDATATLAGVTVTGAGQVTVSPAGGGASFSNASPYIGINFVIATEGIFPSRN